MAAWEPSKLLVRVQVSHPAFRKGGNNVKFLYTWKFLLPMLLIGVFTFVITDFQSNKHYSVGKPEDYGMGGPREEAPVPDLDAPGRGREKAMKEKMPEEMYKKPAAPPPPSPSQPGTSFNYGPPSSGASIIDSAWLKLLGTICGLIGGFGSAVKVVVSFCKGCFNIFKKIFRRKVNVNKIN